VTLGRNLTAGESKIKFLWESSNHFWTMLSYTPLTLGSHSDSNNSTSQTSNLKLPSDCKNCAYMGYLLQYEAIWDLFLGSKIFHFHHQHLLCFFIYVVIVHIFFTKSKIFYGSSPKPKLSSWALVKNKCFILLLRRRSTNTMGQWAWELIQFLLVSLFLFGIKV